MSLSLYYHPLSSFCQKVLVAFYENGTAFEPRLIDLSNETSAAALKAIWPIGKFPVLRDDTRNRVIPESSIIIEYLDLHYPGKVRLIPSDAERACEVRLRDRFFDLYVDTLVGKIVTDRLRPPGKGDPHGVEEAKRLMQSALEILDGEMCSKTWAAGDFFSMADCSAAPAVAYADMIMPFGERYPYVSSYLKRLKERPSFARVLDEARPYLHLVPN